MDSSILRGLNNSATSVSSPAQSPDDNQAVSKRTISQAANPLPTAVQSEPQIVTSKNLASRRVAVVSATDLGSVKGSDQELAGTAVNTTDSSLARGSSQELVGTDKNTTASSLVRDAVQELVDTVVSSTDSSLVTKAVDTNVKAKGEGIKPIDPHRDSQPHDSNEGRLKGGGRLGINGSMDALLRGRGMHSAKETLSGLTESNSNPVVGPFSRLEGKRLAKQILDNIVHLKTSVEGYNDLVYPGGKQGPVKTGSGATKHAVRILSKIKDMRTFDDSVIYAYKVNNKPVGLMSGLMRPSTFHIEYLAADPYARGAGTALIEKAVNISAAKGKGGKISLTPDSTGAKQQYSKLGFIDDDPFGLGIVVLDPKKSDKWVEDNGEYMWANDVGKKYLTGI